MVNDGKRYQEVERSMRQERLIWVGANIAVIVAMICFIITIFTWGRNQALLPQIMERKLNLGMTVEEVEYALALPPGSTARYSSRKDNGRLYVAISNSGIGSWFVPQNAITLVFNPEGKLEKCVAEIHWRIDEEYFPVNLSP